MDVALPSVSPEFAGFADVYEAGETQVVWMKLVADLETPVSAMMKIADGQANSFLLESVEGGAIRGRYSLIGLRPDLIWRYADGRTEVNRSALTSTNDFLPCPVGDADGPLASLRALMAESRIELPEQLPPMSAGLFGYMAYDAVRLVEPRVPDNNPNSLDLPDSLFLRPTVMAIFDALEDTLALITPVWPDDELEDDTSVSPDSSRVSGVFSYSQQGNIKWPEGDWYTLNVSDPGLNSMLVFPGPVNETVRFSIPCEKSRMDRLSIKALSPKSPGRDALSTTGVVYVPESTFPSTVRRAIGRVQSCVHTCEPVPTPETLRGLSLFVCFDFWLYRLPRMVVLRAHGTPPRFPQDPMSKSRAWRPSASSVWQR